MNKIYRIARLELSILFFSPVAWLVLIIFIIQCGVTFVDLVEAREASQQLGSKLERLTVDVFGGSRGFFAAVQNKLYLYIPLLTMGLMSREISSGSIKLLFSSPLTNSQIILGKFFAMMAYGLLLVVVLICILVSGIVSIEALDVRFVLGGILGLYLLICAYSAVGLFMSSLTSYQVVAAISTLAVLAALSFVGNIGQSTDFVRDITYWISIDGRADNFINGLISSKDVIYFLLVIGLFLTLTIMRLNSGRETNSSTMVIGRYSALVVLVLTVGYISSLPAFTTYFDTTRHKDRTLTNSSKALIEQLDKPVKITSYINVINQFAHLGSPKFRIFDLKQFDQYVRYLPGLEMSYVPYYDSTFSSRDFSDKTLEEQAQQYALAHGYEFEGILAPNEIRKQKDLVPEENLFVRYVEYDGKQTPLRMFFDMVGYPQEAEISAALKRLLSKAPVVGVLSDNEERSISKVGDKDYKDITNTLTSRNALINQGFDVVVVSIDSGEKIPQDLAVLMIADPIEAYTAEQLQRITDYINAGGNLIIAGEPGKQAILNPLINKLGLSFTPGTLLQESKELELDLLKTHLTTDAPELGFNLSKEDIISMPGAMGIAILDSGEFETTPILVTDEKYVWNKTEPVNLETDNVGFRPEVDKKIAAPVAVALTRKLPNNEQKIIVFGDADFMSNGELKRYNVRTENSKFITKMFKWFSNGEFPVDITRPKPIDNKIMVSQAGLSWMRMILLGVLPILLGVAGSITLVRRKRK